MGKLVASPFIVLCSILVTYYILIAPGLVTGEKYIDNLKSRRDSRDNGGIDHGGSNGGSGSGSNNGAGMNSGSFGGSGSSSRNMRGFYGFGPKMLQISRSKIPIELDLLVENDDGEKSKRFDDYGHLRFGKRGGEDQFDDYGHMRFGRSSSF